MHLYSVIIGEWWKADVEAVINQAIQSGLPPNISDAHTINGHPGPTSTCSSQGTDTGYTLSCVFFPILMPPSLPIFFLFYPEFFTTHSFLKETTFQSESIELKNVFNLRKPERKSQTILEETTELIVLLPITAFSLIYMKP